MIIRDTPKMKGLRECMVKDLQARGYGNSPIWDAMLRVPRHLFLDSAFERFAYQDKAFEIGDGQTISRPATVAVQTQLLDVFPGAQVLEVGTGSGYQAYVLDMLEVSVYSIERQRNLYRKTKDLLADLKSTVHCFYGDGYKGLPQFAPFDRILVTCGAPNIPQNLVAQLKVGGIMVVPVGEGRQSMTRIERRSETEVAISEHGDFSFVPMLEEKVDN